LIEMVVYVAIIAAVFALMLTGMISLYNASQTARTSRALNLSAATTLERLSRELRDGSSIITASSTLGSSPGILVIETDNASTTGGTFTFSLSGGKVYLTDSTGAKALSATEVNVSELTFWHATGTNGQAVRARITVEPVASSSVAARTFYSSTVLRESYE